MRKLGVLTGSVVLLLATAAAAHAQDYPAPYAPQAPQASRWAIGLRTTAQNIAPESNVDNKLNLQGAGLHVRYRMNRRWGFELSTEHVRAELGGGAFVRESNPVTLSASFHFGRSFKWDYYVLAGIGGTETEITRTTPQGGEINEAFKESHVHLGIGIERQWRHLAVGAELRAIGLERNQEEGDAPRYGESDGPVPKSSSGSQLNFTVSYYF
jgi:hypothetical protein